MAAPTIPPVAKGRAPKRSDRTPDTGPAMSMPDGQGDQRDAGPQRRGGEGVAVQRQPNSL